jgi:hypothetical protein
MFYMTTHKLGDLTLNTVTECTVESRLTIKGLTPDGQKISYKCLMDKVISICVQINPDGYGIIHIIFGYKGIDHPFQLQIVPNMDKKEIKCLVDWFSSMC